MLVHILHGDPQKPNQPTVQWVLDSFRRVAPEPVGLVLETGRYSGTLYAYLVTKLPEETALRGWVKQYKAQARDTQEIPAPPPPPTPESRAPTADFSAKDFPQPAASVTQLLRDFDAPAKSAVPSAPPREAEQPATPLPPKPLPPISAAGGQSGLHSAPPWAPETPRIPAAPKTDPNAGGPAEPFRPEIAARNFPPPVTAPPAKEGPKLGEFTSFFQGPFRGDVPTETPAVTPRQEAPQKRVGDFTSVFGSVKPQPEEPLPSPGIAGNEPAGSFTGWFTPEISPRMSSTTAPPAVGLPRANANPAPGLSASPQPASGLHAPGPPASGLPASGPPATPKEPFVPPKPAPYGAPAPPIFPAPVPSNPPMPRPPAVPPSALAPDGATGAFFRPVSDPAPTPQAAPSGPSAYTQIISARAPSPAADAAGAQKEPPAKAAGSPAFAMPALAVPAMAPPPLPPPPVPPRPAFAVPAPPAAPKLPAAAPKAPKAGVPEKPPVSYWPLILTLTVLFFVAVLLVLYFALKH